MRLKIKKDKIIFLLMGFVLGFAIGVSVLFWRNLTQKIYDTAKHGLIALFHTEEHQTPEKEIIIDKKTVKKKTIETETPKDTNSTSYIDTIAIDSNFVEGIYFHDTLNYDIDSDIYTNMFNTNNGEDVKRESLILKKQIEAKPIKPTENTKVSTNLDSLLIGGKAPKVEKNIYNVEFWESPLNYRGYKKNKNHLVLYGIKNVNDAQLKIISTDLYLITASNYYLIENTTEFKNLIPVSNQNIINQLKEK